MRSTSGGAVSDYRFTAQRQESLGNNWVYDYNGRFYNALVARFVSADTLVPGAGNPQALNRYSYVLNDPLKYIDPTGHCQSEDDREDRAACFRLQREVSGAFDVTILGDWSFGQLGELKNALQKVSDKVGSSVFNKIWSGTRFQLEVGNSPNICGSDACTLNNDNTLVHLYFSAFSRADFNNVIAHELAHVWDQTQNSQIWMDMAKFTGSGWNSDRVCVGQGCSPAPWHVAPGETIPGSYAGTRGWDDWARAFEVWFSGDKTLQNISYTEDQWVIRKQFIDMKVNQVREETSRPWWWPF